MSSNLVANDFLPEKQSILSRIAMIASRQDQYAARIEQGLPVLLPACRVFLEFIHSLENVESCYKGMASDLVSVAEEYATNSSFCDNSTRRARLERIAHVCFYLNGFFHEHGDLYAVWGWMDEAMRWLTFGIESLDVRYERVECLLRYLVPPDWFTDNLAQQVVQAKKQLDTTLLNIECSLAFSVYLPKLHLVVYFLSLEPYVSEFVSATQAGSTQALWAQIHEEETDFAKQFWEALQQPEDERWQWMYVMLKLCLPKHRRLLSSWTYDSSKQHTLFWAVSNNRKDIVKCLLARKVDVRVEDDRALVNAINNKYYEILEILLEYNPHDGDRKRQCLEKVFSTKDWRAAECLLASYLSSGIRDIWARYKHRPDVQTLCDIVLRKKEFHATSMVWEVLCEFCEEHDLCEFCEEHDLCESCEEHNSCDSCKEYKTENKQNFILSSSSPLPIVVLQGFVLREGECFIYEIPTLEKTLNPPTISTI